MRIDPSKRVSKVEDFLLKQVELVSIVSVLSSATQSLL